MITAHHRSTVSTRVSLIFIGMLAIALTTLVSCNRDTATGVLPDDCAEASAAVAQLVYVLGRDPCYEVVLASGYVSSFVVRDRWGHVVYSYVKTTDGDFCWLGTDQAGIDLLVSVYFYTIEILTEDGLTQEIASTVTILQ